MYCPECGTKISHENARFCPECGQRLFVVSIENEKKAAGATTDSNQTGIAGSVKTGGGGFVGRDHHEGKSFVFHLAQPGVYKVILSATLSVLFVFLVARTLLLVQQINNTPQPGTVTVHSGVLTTATVAAATAQSIRATATAAVTARTAEEIGAALAAASTAEASVKSQEKIATLEAQLADSEAARATLEAPLTWTPTPTPTWTPTPTSIPTP